MKFEDEESPPKRRKRNDGGPEHNIRDPGTDRVRWCEKYEGLIAGESGSLDEHADEHAPPNGVDDDRNIFHARGKNDSFIMPMIETLWFAVLKYFGREVSALANPPTMVVGQDATNEKPHALLVVAKRVGLWEVSLRFYDSTRDVDDIHPAAKECCGSRMTDWERKLRRREPSRPCCMRTIIECVDGDARIDAFGHSGPRMIRKRPPDSRASLGLIRAFLQCG